MGVDMRWINTCSGVHAVVVARKPIKGKLIIDPVESKVVIKYDPPAESVQLLTAKVTPTFFFLHVPMTLGHLPVQYERLHLANIWNRENVRHVVVEVSRFSYSRLDEIHMRTICSTITVVLRVDLRINW